ncbi:dynein axonemal heavy chain 9-like [Patagioenas fasciata]|uniref:dynein axonemal heavy chain 9-like n=1 Tax=Patagioenas fasciata TaxID=372321 RepID=UPI003A992197
MVEEKDYGTFDKIQLETVKKLYDDIEETLEQTKRMNIYCHFAKGVGEPSYRPVPTWEELNKILVEALDSYNEVNAAMSLVLFEDAMCHVCRINRILESPRGNALLVGVGGSGKQSLTRLAAFISSLELFQITLRKGYGIPDLKADLANVYLKAGVKNIGIMFLMTDAQVADEQFLVLQNDVLCHFAAAGAYGRLAQRFFSRKGFPQGPEEGGTCFTLLCDCNKIQTSKPKPAFFSGEIPDLFPDDEVENIINSVRNGVKGRGLVDSRETCWKFFIERVRRQLKVVLCFSPVGSKLRVRSRRFPAIISCTAIDWFQEWPQEALESVSLRFLQETETVEDSVKDSISKFMAYVHTSVNEISRLYLSNERRYNYTTPKSFLEQIKLYQNLLLKKGKDLKAKMERLENGLEKLKSTSAQLLDVFPHGAALVIFIIFIIFVIFVIFIIFIIFVIFTIRFRGFWRSEQREMGWGGSSTGPGSSCPASQAHPQLLQLHPKEVASSKNSVAPPRASNGKRPQAEKSWAQKKAPRSEDLQKIPGLLQEIPIINKMRSAVLFSKARRSSRALSIGARVRL